MLPLSHKGDTPETNLRLISRHDHNIVSQGENVVVPTQVVGDCRSLAAWPMMRTIANLGVPWTREWLR